MVAQLYSWPFGFLEKVLNYASHGGINEFRRKHLANGRTADHRGIGHLMVGCILGIEVSKHIGIRAVEGFDSGTNKLAM
jgi:hypothetical protein